MKARVKWNGKLGFVGVSGTNHSVVMDTNPAVGGEGTAPSPLEYVLMGLAGCAGVDVALILEKKRLNVDGFEIFATAERAEEFPKVFTKIELDFVFTGTDLREKPLEDTVRLSLEKYCSVAAMLEKTAEITWKVTIAE